MGIVVYRKDGVQPGSLQKIHRVVLHGPILYSPDGLEWLHTFVWHGTDESTLRMSVQRKLPGLLRFQKLRLTPDQVYFDISDVRSRDDARITVKATVFMQ